MLNKQLQDEDHIYTVHVLGERKLAQCLGPVDFLVNQVTIQAHLPNSFKVEV